MGMQVIWIRGDDILALQLLPNLLQRLTKRLGPANALKRTRHTFSISDTFAYWTGLGPSGENNPPCNGRSPVPKELSFFELARPHPTVPAAKATAQTDLPFQPFCGLVLELPEWPAWGPLRRVVEAEKLRPARAVEPASWPLKPWPRRGLAECLADM